MSANENDDPNRAPRWDIPSDSSDEESQEETSEGGETQVVARRPIPLQNSLTQLMVFLFLINLANSTLICGNACRGYSSFASRPADERIPLSGHVIMQIMRFVASNFCDSLTSPVPQELVSRIFAAIFEGPLRHARWTMTAFLNSSLNRRIWLAMLRITGC